MSALADRIAIRLESPDQPEVRALLAELDRYLATLYAPEDNHILSVEELMQPEVSFVVLRDGTDAIGTGAVRRMSGEVATGGMPYGEIKRMYVAPARRGERLAARLLDALEQQLRSDGYSLALLETGRHQHEAVRLYERCGYAPWLAFGGYPDNGLSAFYGKRL